MKPFIYPWRAVLAAETIGWWELLGKYRTVYLDLACGHCVERRVKHGSAPPKRVRCEVCDFTERPEQPEP